MRIQVISSSVETHDQTFRRLEKLGRVRLSRHFFMRDFMFSETAAAHGILNIPDDADLAIEAGRRLCEELLEPLQSAFGRLSIRSGYRSIAVNDLCYAKGLGCAASARNFARHIWDKRDAQGGLGAMACVVSPWLADFTAAHRNWHPMAEWVQTQLPYSELIFFPRLAAFNIGWHERPKRIVRTHIREA